MKALLILVLLGAVVFGIYSCNPDNPVDGALSMITGSTPTPRYTPLPIDVTATAAAVKISDDIREATIAAEGLLAANAQGTSVAAQSTAEYNRVRATQAVEQATAAMRDYFAQETAQSEDAHQRATAESVISTRAAQATADYRAVIVQGWTATGDAQILAGHMETTKLANFATATSLANDAIATQAAATVVAFAVIKANERTELTNKALAVLPFVTYAGVSIIVIAVGAMLLPVLLTRLSTISRDKRGDAPIIFDRKGNYLDPDRNPFPIATLGRHPVIPESLPVELAERHASRDQMIDLTTRGLPGAQLSGKNGKLPQLPAATPNRALFKVLADHELPASISPDTVRILDSEWKDNT